MWRTQREGRMQQNGVGMPFVVKFQNGFPWDAISSVNFQNIKKKKKKKVSKKPASLPSSAFVTYFISGHPHSSLSLRLSLLVQLLEVLSHFEPWSRDHGSVVPSLPAKSLDSFFLRLIRNMNETTALSARRIC